MSLIQPNQELNGSHRPQKHNSCWPLLGGDQRHSGLFGAMAFPEKWGEEVRQGGREHMSSASC